MQGSRPDKNAVVTMISPRFVSLSIEEGKNNAIYMS